MKINETNINFKYYTYICLYKSNDTTNHINHYVVYPLLRLILSLPGIHALIIGEYTCVQCIWYMCNEDMFCFFLIIIYYF